MSPTVNHEVQYCSCGARVIITRNNATTGMMPHYCGGLITVTTQDNPILKEIKNLKLKDNDFIKGKIKGKIRGKYGQVPC